MEIGQSGLAEFLECLVIASAPANPADPAGLADRLVAHLVPMDDVTILVCKVKEGRLGKVVGFSGIKMESMPSIWETFQRENMW